MRAGDDESDREPTVRDRPLHRFLTNSLQEEDEASGEGTPGEGIQGEGTPERVLAISVFALAVAAAAAFVRPAGGGELLGFVWVLALVPPFLLSFYRGWSGAVVALAAGMLVLVGAELAGRLVLDREVDWWIFGVATTGLIVVSLGSGVMAEMLHRSGGHPLGIGTNDRQMQVLRRAVNEGELVLHFQPIVSFEDRRTRGMEVLVRWDHPVRGLVGLDDFFAFSESTGLMVPLGNWVLEEALLHYALWRERFPMNSRFFLSVNFSGSQCRQPGLRGRVRSLLETHDMRPGDLQLEVTEETLQEAGTPLGQLKSLGLRVAIDSFGEGYSSLGQLSRLDVDALKIDGAFVRTMVDDERDRATVEAILQVSRTLGIPVIAGGVETGRQFEELRDMGCQYGQGHFFAEPFPAAVLESRLGEGDPARPPA